MIFADRSWAALEPLVPHSTGIHDACLARHVESSSLRMTIDGVIKVRHRHDVVVVDVQQVTIERCGGLPPAIPGEAEPEAAVRLDIRASIRNAERRVLQ